MLVITGQENFRILSKAKELAIHTFKITSNCNKYPKKYRFSLVDKMQNKSLELYNFICEANRSTNERGQERRLLQTSAITCCDELQFYVELSMKLDIIAISNAEYWTKLITDIKHMTLSWRSKDSKNSKQAACYMP